MSDTATLSTVIDAGVQDALVKFCKRRGIKIRYLIEQALIEQLEDEIDLEAYPERRDEATVPFEKVMAKLRSTITESVTLLSLNPSSELLKIRKLKEAVTLDQMRLGEHGLAYEIRKERMNIRVIKIGHRREVHRQGKFEPSPLALFYREFAPTCVA